ncbi:MAG: trehalose-phosphatase [Acidimicrobiales bacterium]
MDALKALVDRYGLVGVISGRPAGFLAEHLDVAGLARWGSYGLEWVGADGAVQEDPLASSWRATVSEVVEEAHRVAPAGVRVEDKGLSVTLHVREVPSAEPWVRTFARSWVTQTGLVQHDAKMSVELRPPLDIDKGTVVRRLLGEHFRSACFVGDDRGDLSAFDALAGADHAVRVAVRSPETPTELLDAADLVVDGPEGVLILLNVLARGVPLKEP